MNSESSSTYLSIDPRPLPPGAVARYARHLSLAEIGLKGQEKLWGARVLVVGAGGLGSPIIYYLAAAGVGYIRIVDPDRVDLSNLQRQVIHSTAEIGQPKVASARRRVAELNPDIEVDAHQCAATPDTLDALTEGIDLVLDGSDNFDTRYWVADYCARHDLPLIWGSIDRFTGYISTFVDGYRLRDVFPTPPAPGSVGSCADVGVFGVLPGVIGTMMATEAITLITGVGQPLAGRLGRWDATSSTFTTFSFARTVQPKESVPQPEQDAVALRSDAEMHVLERAAAATSSLEEIPISALPQLREAGFRSLDVREPAEWDGGIIEESVLVALSSIRSGNLGPLADMSREQPLAVYCKTGPRSREAARALSQLGFERVVVLTGGIMQWWLEC